MAELKWNNVDGSNTTQGLLAYQNAEKTMYDRVKDFTGGLQNHLGVMQEGLNKAHEYRKDQNTQDIINQMLNTENLDSLKQAQASGLADSFNLRNRFGSEVDLSKINQAKASWVSDTEARANKINSAKDYSDAAVQLRSQVEAKIASGEVEEARKLLANNAGVLSNGLVDKLNEAIINKHQRDRDFGLQAKQLALNEQVQKSNQDEANARIAQMNANTARTLLETKQLNVKNTLSNNARAAELHKLGEALKENHNKLQQKLIKNINRQASSANVHAHKSDTLSTILNIISQGDFRKAQQMFQQNGHIISAELTGDQEAQLAANDLASYLNSQLSSYDEGLSALSVQAKNLQIDVQALYDAGILSDKAYQNAIEFVSNIPNLFNLNSSNNSTSNTNNEDSSNSNKEVSQESKITNNTGGINTSISDQVNINTSVKNTNSNNNNNNNTVNSINTAKPQDNEVKADAISAQNSLTNISVKNVNNISNKGTNTFDSLGQVAMDANKLINPDNSQKNNSFEVNKVNSVYSNDPLIAEQQKIIDDALQARKEGRISDKEYAQQVIQAKKIMTARKEKLENAPLDLSDPKVFENEKSILEEQRNKEKNKFPSPLQKYPFTIQGEQHFLTQEQVLTKLGEFTTREEGLNFLRNMQESANPDMTPAEQRQFNTDIETYKHYLDKTEVDYDNYIKAFRANPDNENKKEPTRQEFMKFRLQEASNAGFSSIIRKQEKLLGTELHINSNNKVMRSITENITPNTLKPNGDGTYRYTKTSFGSGDVKIEVGSPNEVEKAIDALTFEYLDGKWFDGVDEDTIKDQLKEFNKIKDPAVRGIVMDGYMQEANKLLQEIKELDPEKNSARYKEKIASLKNLGKDFDNLKGMTSQSLDVIHNHVTNIEEINRRSLDPKERAAMAHKVNLGASKAGLSVKEYVDSPSFEEGSIQATRERLNPKYIQTMNSINEQIAALQSSFEKVDELGRKLVGLNRREFGDLAKQYNEVLASENSLAATPEAVENVKLQWERAKELGITNMTDREIKERDKMFEQLLDKVRKNKEIRNNAIRAQQAL